LRIITELDDIEEVLAAEDAKGLSRSPATYLGCGTPPSGGLVPIAI